MRQQVSVTNEKIDKVKECIKRGLSLRNCASRAGVSFYTAWCISKGFYDTDKSLHTFFKKQDETLFYHHDKMFI